MQDSPACWIVTEGMAGTERPCLAVAEALGVEPVVKRTALVQPWKALSPWLGFERSSSFTGDPISSPWPELLITSGRKSVAVSRFVARESRGQTIRVHIQDPKVSSSEFDLVAVPQHDRLRGPNVLVTDGSPNRVSPETLAQAKDRFSALFSDLPAPRVAVLIGGNSRAYTFSAERADALTKQLCNLSEQYGVGLMVTASRRTPSDVRARLESGLAGTPHVFWDGTGDNPYFGMLAWADHLLVTEESVSMVSEAGSTGKPVYRLGLDGGSPRIAKFHAHLEKTGVLVPFRGFLEDRKYVPLRDSEKIAAEIRRLMHGNAHDADRARSV